MRIDICEVDSLSAVTGWCWIDYHRYSVFCLKYWRVMTFAGPVQNKTTRRHFYTTGLMSRNRGKHWNRKSKIARN